MENNKARVLVYKILYQVLIEIREEAYIKENKKIHLLSDMIHNIPLVLMNAENEEDYSKIMKQIEDRAKGLGIDSWLKNALNQFSE
ncbi:MAG TPA: hypothetical protein VIN08_09915 [Ohtaekwangia sp.]|uniref:hypothetical protein n=1 Tax=Ohtaekwangia sp. TaxID=2066019 RepID=UPI002F95AF8A